MCIAQRENKNEGFKVEDLDEGVIDPASQNEDVEPDDSGITAALIEEKKELLPNSPTNVKENIKQKYLTEMPEDFFLFWDFCQFIHKEKPCGNEQIMQSFTSK